MIDFLLIAMVTGPAVGFQLHVLEKRMVFDYWDVYLGKIAGPSCRFCASFWITCLWMVPASIACLPIELYSAGFVLFLINCYFAVAAVAFVVYKMITG